MNIIYKSFYRKKNIRNYILIITCLMITITLCLVFKNYIVNVINSNYNKSFIYAKITNEEQLSLLNQIDNINEIRKCIDEDGYIVEDITVKSNQIYISSNSDIIYNNDFEYIETDSLQANVIVVSPTLFSTLEYDNGYYITLKNWMNRSDIIDLMFSNNIETDPHIYLNNDIKLEDIYLYLNITIMILAVVFTLIYIFTIILIIVDQRKKNKILKVLGFSKKEIFKFNSIQLITLNLVCIFANEIVKIIVFIFSKIYIVSIIYYLILFVITLLLLLGEKFIFGKNK